MACVAVENLTKTFKDSHGKSVEAVNRLNLTVADREFLVLVGPSGCGKTTTLRLIAGLEEATHGSVSIDGRNLNGVPARDRDLAMVFQHHALFPHMTARENMAFGLKLRKHPRAEIIRRVGEAAEMLDLTDCLDRRPEALSGGQRQRVALGRALVRQPKAFLFDEPLSNLDAQMRGQMRREIARLHSRLNATMIYVTHDQVEALTLGDRIAVMQGGTLQQVAGPMELYRRPANRFVAGFIGSPPMNFFDGALKLENGSFWFQQETTDASPAFQVRVNVGPGSRLANFTGKKVVLGLRPEHVIEPAGGKDAVHGQGVAAVVQEVEPMGPEAVLYATSGPHSLAARVRPDFQAAAGARVSLEFDLRHAHFFDATTGDALEM